MTVLGAAFLAALVQAGAALGQSPDDSAPAELTGTLAKVRATRALTIAYRGSSVPFSYLSKRGEPIGYSIELCRKLAEAIGEAVGRELELKWLPVTSETRIEAIVSGRADLECGSTTNNLERQKRVAFSPVIFVAGTRLLVERGSPIRSYRNLGGKTVVVTAGTTNESAMKETARRFKIDIRMATARDHAEAYAQFEAGRADAFATDDVLLYGLVAQHGVQQRYHVVGEFLSYDPYGIMFRKGDPQLAAAVERAFRDLAEDGEIERQYKRWFLQRLPESQGAGHSLNLPMSPQLETLIRAMRVKPE
ncbi:MAG TPA: amino acid ABC transporter substrate-binding protein [Burkholderiales bacterium]|nr:amino acid ABC transporter substrate-binding protein [Burkholderiales bacterium]